MSALRKPKKKKKKKKKKRKGCLRCTDLHWDGKQASKKNSNYYNGEDKIKLAATNKELIRVLGFSMSESVSKVFFYETTVIPLLQNRV